MRLSQWHMVFLAMCTLYGSGPFSMAVANAQTATAAAPAQPEAAPAKTKAPPEQKPVRMLKNLNQKIDKLVKTMQDGGVVLLMRHERTEVPSRGDDYSRPPTDCMAQRNLSVAGVAGAVETGVALRALNIPLGDILASPMCRTMDTGRMMFSRVMAEPRLMHHDDIPGRTVLVSGTELNALLDSLPATKDNPVLISHIGNIYFATGQRLSEGEIAVLQRDKKGTYVILGTVDPGYIGASARQALKDAEKPAEPKPVATTP